MTNTHAAGRLLRACALLVAVGCGGDDDVTATLGGVDAACGPATAASDTTAASEARACAAGLVCRDGACRGRAAESVTDAELPPLATFDVVVHETEVGPDDAAADATDDVATDADTAEVVVQTVFVGDHNAGETPSTTRLTLGLNQAAARELIVPAGGPWRPTGVEVIPLTAEGACGRFRAQLWLPDEAGAFAINASWQSDEFLVSGIPSPIVVFFSGAPDVAPGPLRAGIAYLGPCEGAMFGAWIAIDSSGDASDSFIWAGNWISGAVLGMPGHWAIRLALTSGLP